MAKICSCALPQLSWLAKGSFFACFHCLRLCFWVHSSFLQFTCSPQNLAYCRWLKEQCLAAHLASFHSTPSFQHGSSSSEVPWRLLPILLPLFWSSSSQSASSSSSFYSSSVCSLQGNSALQKLLRVQSMGEPPFPVTRHTFPDYSTVAAPIALPVEKDRVRLQVCLT